MAKRRQENEILVGLDIGTSKVVAIVGTVTPEQRVEIIGHGTFPSYGLKRGMVVNIESTVQSIQRAIEEAELTSGYEIQMAYTGIAGSHIQSLNSHGMVAIRDAEVSPEDIDRVIEAAKAVAIPQDQRILHILPQEFILDSQDGIHDPVGMSGLRLEAKVHMITGSVSATQNIAKCVQRCGLDVGDIILEQLASSHAVLREDEKHLGICLIDIGAGTSDIAVFRQGAIRHTAVIPIAGDQVTHDIAVALRVPTQVAEDIKHHYAVAVAAMVSSTDSFEIPTIGDRAGRKVSRRLLAEVVQARYEELLIMIHQELRRMQLDQRLAAGIVLTGGASKVPGLLELAEAIFDLPVRLGIPINTVDGADDLVHDPMFATSIGLLLHGQQQRSDRMQFRTGTLGMKNIWRRMMGWFQGNF